MIRTSITHNMKKIHTHIRNYVLKKMLYRIIELKKTQDVTIDILKDWREKLFYQGDVIIDIKF